MAKVDGSRLCGAPHSVSKTRVNALMALRRVRDTNRLALDERLLNDKVAGRVAAAFEEAAALEHLA
jgi:hypothetical protein